MTNSDYKYLKYNDFWQNSLQRLEGITKTLERDIYYLEKKYIDFDSIYDKITVEINTLTSIYSSLNNLKGREYLLKLKAILDDYKKRYTHGGIDFKTIYFLNSKINKLREQSFNSFPRMDHTFILYKDLENTADYELDENIQRYAELRKSSYYKWITFFRNGSWFIASYNKLQIIKSSDAEISGDKSGNFIKYNENLIEIFDIFSRFSNSKKIMYYIITEHAGELKAFASEKLGKIIMSDKNFITTGLKAFKKSTISPGRFRIFGKNHISL